MRAALLSFAILAATTYYEAVAGPAQSPKTEIVRLTELWRVGEDEDGVVFGQIGGVVVDDDGRLYVTDVQARQISVFSPEGVFLRTLGREGEGPGEFREPRSLALLPNGNVGVIHEQPPKVVCFRPADGEFVEDFHLAQDPKHPFQRLSYVVCRARSLVVYASDIRQSPEDMRVTARLMRYDATGKFLGECDSLGFAFSVAKPVAHERYDLIWGVGPDDRIYVNRNREYDIAIYGHDCNGEGGVTREYKRVKRSSAEMDSIRAFYRRVGSIGDAKLEIFDHARDIAWLSIDDAGRLWVLSSRGRIDLPPDSLAHFDVYDTRGRLDRTVDLKAERGARDWYYMHRNRFYVVHRDTMVLVAYRLPQIGP